MRPLIDLVARDKKLDPVWDLWNVLAVILKTIEKADEIWKRQAPAVAVSDGRANG